MALEQHLHEGLAMVIEDPITRDRLFFDLVERLSTAMELKHSPLWIDRLREREEKGATSTPQGVAFPHAVGTGLETTIVVAANAQTAVDFGNPEHPSCDLVFCLFGSADRPWEHVKLLARLARIVQSEDARMRLREAKSDETFRMQLLEEDCRYA